MSKAETAMDFLKRWMFFVDVVRAEKQFIYKVKNNNSWKMGKGFKQRTNSSDYDLVVIYCLDTKRDITININDITKVFVVPKGSKKEAAVVLYGG